VLNAPIPSAMSRPSCSSRAVAVVRVRPTRSTTGRTVIGPVCGGRRKWTVKERGWRSSSATAAYMPRSTIAMT
jgi:hypothetical protein